MRVPAKRYRALGAAVAAAGAFAAAGMALTSHSTDYGVFIGSTPTPPATATATATSTATPAACTTTYTVADMDNSPFNGDNVNTDLQGASGGEVLCFASGTYTGIDFYNASPASDVTLRPADGATVTMGDITANHVSHVKVTGFTGGSSVSAVEVVNSAGNSDHITVTGNAITGRGTQVVGNTNTNAAITFSNNVFDGQDGSTTDLDRLKITGNTGCPSGIVVDGNEMKNGTTDGVSIGSSCGVIVSHNYIHDIGTPVTGGCTALNGQSPHCDGIQCEAACTDLEIFGNYIARTDTGITDYDGPSSGTNVHDNVLWDVVGVGSGTINLGSTSSPSVKHNTLAGTYGPKDINLGSKSGNNVTTGAVIRDNITPGGVANDGDQASTGTTQDHNMCSAGCTGTGSLIGKTEGTDYSFTGGATPTTLAGFALAAGSAGISAASDGLNMGVNP